MTHRLAPYILASACTVLTLGCAATQPRVESTATPGPCDHRLAEVEMAAYDDTAREAVRGFLYCCSVQEGRPDPDLDRRVETALKGGQRSERFDPDAVVDWFFDRARLRDLPVSNSALDQYRDQLGDQALAARAQGDLEMAGAIEQRATKLTKLGDILDALED